MTSFDPDEFLEWLEDQEGPIPAYELEERNFPMEELHGCTGPIQNDEFCYYRHDLRTIAEGKPILD